MGAEVSTPRAYQPSFMEQRVKSQRAPSPPLQRKTWQGVPSVLGPDALPLARTNKKTAVAIDEELEPPQEDLSC